MLESYQLIDIHDYRKLKIVGTGSFGIVFRIQKKDDGKLYAAKIFRDVFSEESDTNQVKVEAAIYSRINHLSIAQYYGVSPCDFDDEPYPCLILEYYRNGSLDLITEKQRTCEPIPNWDNTKLLINLYGIAAGAAYLHSKNIMYRDLKPQNILEDENYYPKLSDFGISKIFTKESETHTMQVGTAAYMAPEIIDKNAHYTTAIDVYSYAMVVYELIVKQKPIPKDIKSNFITILKATKEGKRPEISESTPKCYKELITKCWSPNPKDRPTFVEITEMLKNNREFITELDADEEEYNAYIKMVSGETPYLGQGNGDQKEKMDEIIEEDDKPLSIKNVHSADLSKFKIMKMIGEGSFGVVYEVEDKESKEIFAAKISKSEIYECLKDEIDTVNFIREVTILSKINHQSIMKFIGFSPINFKGTPKPVIITELLKNGTLEDVIELERKGLSCDQWDDTKKLINIYGIASSMAYLHRLSILHRDLKPANILVDEFLFPKLADFGLSKEQFSKSEDCQQRNQTGLIGTPIYISPEIYEQSLYTKKCDVYAFGFIVYEIMTSEVPSVGNERYQLMWNIMKGVRPKFNIDIPACYKELIENCWNQDPNKRPNFDEIVDDLRNNPDFITDLVDEGEYLDYIDMIDNKNINKTFQKIEIPNKEDEIQNISKGKGFINIDDFVKQKRNGRNKFWKLYSVSKKATNDVFMAKVSTIPISNFTKDEVQKLIKEVEVLCALNHPSLLKFIGYSSINFKKEQKSVIITEYSFNQTLENIIEMKRKNIQSKELDSTKIHSIIYGIASAMAYLHSHGILHLDLKPCNIFFDKQIHPKLTDYGFYTKLQISKSMSCQSASRMQNVPNYSAPEILNSEEPTEASDVYSFALIVYELLTKEKPFSHLHTTNEIFREVVLKCGRPKFPQSPEDQIPECYKEMISACWSQDPMQRPSFDSIVNGLKNDARFFAKTVKKEEFFKYVDMIEQSCEKQNAQKVDECELECQMQKVEETCENQEAEAENKAQKELNVKQVEQPSTLHPAESLSIQQESEKEVTLPEEKKLLQSAPSTQETLKKQPEIEVLHRISEHENNSHTDNQKLPKQPSKTSIKPPPESSTHHLALHPSPMQEKPLEPPVSQLSSQKPQLKTSLQPPTSQPPSRKHATPVLPSSASNSSSDLSSAYVEVRNDSCDTNWALARFDSASKAWKLCGKGSGGLDEMVLGITDDFAGFCYLRTSSTRNGVSRDVFVLAKCVMSGVRMITKAQMNAKRGEVEGIFNYSNVTIEAESISELVEEINKKLK